MKKRIWRKDIIKRIQEYAAKKIKKLWQNIKGFLAELRECAAVNRRKFIKSGVVLIVSLALILVLGLISSSIAENVPDQSSYLEWGGKNYAQVSCYTSRADGFSADEIMRFEHEMNTALKTSEQEELKWTDAYSGKGALTVTNGNASVEGTAYGVGNNFFLFHPLQLLSGGYINTKNVMKDYILLDEEAAWRLFGSSDIAGMYAYINGEPHVIAGVYKQPEGWPNEAAGNGEITFYVSYEVLKKYNIDAAVTCYEVIMENSVEHYVYNYIKNYFQPKPQDGAVDTNKTAKTALGQSGLGLSGEDADREIKIIENSDRYSIEKKWENLKNFGLNAIKTDEIVYPFWENVAAAYGSVLTLMFFVQIVGWAVICLCIIQGIIRVHQFRKKLRI